MEYGEGQGKGVGLETVRALHQTVTALRIALEESKNEILKLKSKEWPTDSIQETLRHLSVENHVLRRKLLEISPQELSKIIVDNKESGKQTIQDYQLEDNKQLEEGKPKELEIIEGMQSLITL